MAERRRLFIFGRFFFFFFFSQFSAADDWNKLHQTLKLNFIPIFSFFFDAVKSDRAMPFTFKCL